MGAVSVIFWKISDNEIQFLGPEKKIMMRESVICRKRIRSR